MGQAAYSAPVYGQPQDQGRPRETAGQAPVGGWAESDQEVAPRKSKRGLIISFIVVVILIVVGVGGFVGWSLTNRASDFTVGACVKQDGNDAIVTDCASAGAGVYKITSIVGRREWLHGHEPALAGAHRAGWRRQEVGLPRAGELTRAEATRSDRPEATDSDIGTGRP